MLDCSGKGGALSLNSNPTDVPQIVGADSLELELELLEAVPPERYWLPDMGKYSRGDTAL